MKTNITHNKQKILQNSKPQLTILELYTMLSRMCYTAINNMISFLKSFPSLYGAHSIRFLSSAMAACYLVGILLLVVSCVVASTLVLYRLLCWLAHYLCSFQKIFWLRIATGVLLLLSIPLSGLAFVTLCTIVVSVGTTTILTTSFVVAIVGMVTSFVVVFVVRLLHLLYRLLCWLIGYVRSFPMLVWLRIFVGMLLMVAIPLSGFVFLTLCTIIASVGCANFLTICFFVAIVGMVLSFVGVVIVRLVPLLYRLVCDLYSWITAWVGKRQKNAILTEMETRTVDEIDLHQQDLDLEELEFETEEPEEPTAVESQVPTDEMEIHPTTASHPSVAPRRSLRIKRRPDRFVPSSERTIQQVPLGSFFDHGVRRSGRIAARLAKL